MAGRQGLEPRYADPESAVLPLDDLPVSFSILTSRGLVAWLAGLLFTLRQDTTPAKVVLPISKLPRRIERLPLITELVGLAMQRPARLGRKNLVVNQQL